MEKVDTVVYHKNCNDGFVSAFIVWKWFRDNGFHQPMYVAMGYGDRKITSDCGQVLPQLVEWQGKNILVVDFSFTEAVMKKVIEKNEILIIDHHETAMKNLANIPDKHKIFDMSHCGAYLTWKHLFPDVEVPPLVHLVQDRDLWSKLYPSTNALAKYILSRPYSNDTILPLLEYKNLTHAMVAGQNIQDYDDFTISFLGKNACVKLWNEKLVVYINSGLHKSDIGSKLLELHPLADFSAIYHYDDSLDTTIFSLRSRKNGNHVGKVAESYGGGGHQAASSCSFKGLTNQLPETVSFKSYWYLKTAEEHEDWVLISCRMSDINEELQYFRRWKKALVFCPT